MNVFSKLRKAIHKSPSISSREAEERGCTFKMQLLNLCIYTEEVDSLFCVTVISNHLLSPKKGHPVQLVINRNCVQVIWLNKQKRRCILCCHRLNTITYQFHSSYKSRLYGYTAIWGRRKICLVFQTPRFNRTKGITIRQYYDKMVHLRVLRYGPEPKHITQHVEEAEECSTHLQIPPQDREELMTNRTTRAKILGQQKHDQ